MISDDIKLDYDDILIVPGKSSVASRKEVELACKIEFRRRGKRFSGIPIVAANMDGVGTLEMADGLRRHGILTCLTKFHGEDELAGFFNSDPARLDHCAVTVGIGDNDLGQLDRVAERLDSPLKFVCLDVANGYTDRFVSCVREFRGRHSDVVIIAGNVVTPDQTVRLIEAGADVVKVGIGGGSVCETRIKTGVGFPQFSVVLECVHAAHRLGACIMADGGCITPGDVAKALAGGADFVMLGGYFSGHPEGGGKVVDRFYKSDEVTEDGQPIIERKRFVEFYGMSSKTANDKHFGGLQNYRSSEGRTVLVPFKPSLDGTVRDLLGGLRSACSYVGARKLRQLPEKAEFVRCNSTHNRVFEGLG